MHHLGSGTKSFLNPITYFEPKKFKVVSLIMQCTHPTCHMKNDLFLSSSLSLPPFLSLTQQDNHPVSIVMALQ